MVVGCITINYLLTYLISYATAIMPMPYPASGRSIVMFAQKGHRGTGGKTKARTTSLSCTGPSRRNGATYRSLGDDIPCLLAAVRRAAKK